MGDCSFYLSETQPGSFKLPRSHAVPMGFPACTKSSWRCCSKARLKSHRLALPMDCRARVCSTKSWNASRWWVQRTQKSMGCGAWETTRTKCRRATRHGMGMRSKPIGKRPNLEMGLVFGFQTLVRQNSKGAGESTFADHIPFKKMVVHSARFDYCNTSMSYESWPKPPQKMMIFYMCLHVFTIYHLVI